MSNLRHAINLSLFLFAIWLLLSGHYTPLLLTFGVLSSLFVVSVAMRAELVDQEVEPVLIKPSALLYWVWLGREVVRSNIDVTRRILDPKLRISPEVVRVRATQRTDLGRVTYANSITLVPGTVTMRVEGDEITAHALTHAIAADLKGGEMDRRVTDMERSF
ncbi:MAG: Na+/H+ antiporter subunit E [Gammaproteobacteria bacterium]